jgi:RHS repeat-associated protein
VWLWHQAEPFGNTVPDENPSGLGTFDIPLRLPGQYFDKETNLHYNYFRDYDPSIGIYKQSDPIGIDGGLNIYAYVRDPLQETDRYGLMGSRELTPEQKEQLCKKNGWPTKPDPCATQEQCFDTAEEWLAVRCKKAKGKWGLPFGNVVEQELCRYCWTLYSKECPGKTPSQSCNQNACLPTPTPKRS